MYYDFVTLTIFYLIKKKKKLNTYLSYKKKSYSGEFTSFQIKILREFWHFPEHYTKCKATAACKKHKRDYDRKSKETPLPHSCCQRC